MTWYCERESEIAIAKFSSNAKSDRWGNGLAQDTSKDILVGVSKH